MRQYSASRRTAPDPTMPPVLVDPRADAWEHQELEKVKLRFEKLNNIIAEWEADKKNKAKQQYERIEAELEEKRARALQHYKEEIARIESISGEAKAQEEDNMKREEQKVKEKANQLRYTGRLPEQTCFIC
ncbi:remorin 4.1-like [Ipomoea triloba]|uniref:remorin 4.1-like n=1 Tax=Ipomoea triloba TaxID=35885 RepID=UPI00125D4828|nr:remorin 4.1-like [Ipomoea triloba]